jgi:hypothetical protein
MSLSVYAGAWIRVLAPGEKLMARRRLVIPCEDVDEAESIRRMMVRSGAARGSLLVITGMLPAKPANGGTYVQISVADALEMFED